MKRCTRQLIENLRETPLFCQLIPMEAKIGWPLPLRREGRVYLIFLLFGASTKSPGQTLLFPPFAQLTLDWSTQTVMEYINFRFSNPFQSVKWEQSIGTFPHPAVASLTVREYQEKRQDLLAMYDEMFESLSRKTSLSTDWNAKFSQLISTLMEPTLKPYYHAINPKFIDRFVV